MSPVKQVVEARVATRPPDPGREARKAQALVLRERAALWVGLDKELSRMIASAIAGLVAQIAGAPTDYQQWVLPRLVDNLKRLADELALGLATRSSQALREQWMLGERAVTAPLTAAMEAERQQHLATATGAALQISPTLGLGAVDLRQLRALQSVNTHRISGATTDLVNRINGELGKVVLGAQTPHQAMQAVQAQMPDRTTREVRGIVTTNLATAFNTASYQTLTAQAARDPSLKKQWRRSGKLHSRWNHDLADGQVQDIDKPFVLQAGKGGDTVELMYPADPAAPIGEVINCGCVALAWKATWKMSNAGGQPLTAAEIKVRKERQAEQDGKRLPKVRTAAKTSGKN